jgi:hypothetical protein
MQNRTWSLRYSLPEFVSFEPAIVYPLSLTILEIGFR